MRNNWILNNWILTRFETAILVAGATLVTGGVVWATVIG
jgi:hypothetical protein